MNPIIAKVQKLLATAADAGATPAEAATAARIASQLMASHRITDREIREHATAAARAAGRTDVDDLEQLVLGPRKLRQDGSLAVGLAALLGIGVYWSWRSELGRPSKVMMGYGLPTDLAVARELFVWLSAEMRTKAKAFAVAHGVRLNSVPARSYMDGFAAGLYAKANEARTERMRSTETVTVQLPAESTTGESRALTIVIAEAEQQHERALVRKAAKLGIGRARATSVRRDQSAYIAGVAAGRATNVSREVVR